MPRKGTSKVWKQVMEIIVEGDLPQVTAAALAERLHGKPHSPEEAARSRSAAGQILRRLRQWGYLRPGGPIYPEEGGRPQIVYELTERSREQFGKSGGKS